MEAKQFKDKELKVSWWATRRDGLKTQMHVAGRCIDVKDGTFILEGNQGELFTIPLNMLINIKVKKG